MQRIPNPVSDLNIFLRVFRDGYKILKQNTDFGLDDITRAMIAQNNVTSQGAIGDEALRRSTRTDRSRDPLYNQSKMYAELYRTLGWMQSTSSKLTYTYSLLGDHIASAKNPAPLLCECLLGIAYPNEVLGVLGDQTVRVISSILLVLDTLGSISRDEMIAGPMSISDDTDVTSFTNMISLLLNCRSSSGLLDKVINEIAVRRHITRSPTMENYTRFPMAALPWAGWGVKRGRGKIFITEEGKAMASKLRVASDFRLNDFLNIPDSAKPAFIRFSFYSMLARGGFDINPVHALIRSDKHILERHGMQINNDILFSPFQQLSRDTIRKWIPELVPESDSVSYSKIEKLNEARPSALPITRERQTLIFELSEHIADVADSTTELITEIKFALQKAYRFDEAIDLLFTAYANVNRDIFYPLVVNLFCVIGFDCRLSRGGQNYERADAIILDPVKSIPIEIKSPGEETEISVKGVRQALENKVVLLSRKSYQTDVETTSLVVGFNPPNNRSEVHELIDDIQTAFNVRVGVIDFKSLLTLAVHSVANEKKVHLHDFHLLQGAIHVSHFTPTH